METKTSICNLALSHLAIGKEISNVETDTSEEAKVCRRYYNIALRKVLRNFIVDFSSKIAPAQLIKSNPNDEWAFSYRYPNDCLYLRRILSGSRNDTRQSRIPYKISNDTVGKVIYTDRSSAYLEYTVYIDNPSFYSDDFILAFSYYLAFLISPRITAGDEFGLGDRALKLYFAEISNAIHSSTLEGQIDEEPDSEFIRTR